MVVSQFERESLVNDQERLAGGLLVRWGLDLPISVGAVAMSLSTHHSSVARKRPPNRHWPGFNLVHGQELA